jgi:3-phosphoshikimate 1-carboxyvinyltransferase
VAAALVAGSDVLLPRIGMNPRRNGIFLCLHEMGADITLENERIEAGEPVADIRVRGGKMLQGITVPESRVPSMIDEFPILFVAASCANGTSYMSGLEELRVKESDRLAIMAKGLEACGVKLEMGKDSLTIHGTGKPPKGGALIETALDHRIAMSFLVMGMVSDEAVTIDDVRPISTSFPNFVALINGLTGNESIRKK